MRKRDSSGMWAIRAALFLITASTGVGGCTKTVVETDRQPNLMIPCRDAGTCECEANADCTDSARPLCVDGMCASAVVYIDGGGADPDAAIGDGCGFRDPEPEQCNGRDDDCDTRVDEDFKGADGLFSTPGNCGQCGLRCDNLLPNLLEDGAGQAVPGSTACRNDGGGVFTCEPVLCATGFAPFFDAAGNAVVCLPRIAAECQPCAQAADCGSGSGHACSPLGGEGSFCLAFCDARSGDATCTGTDGAQDCCPGGTTCRAQDGGHVCVPNSNSCRCTPDNLGLQRVCSRTGDAGATTCLGVETCVDMSGTAGWSGCDTGFVTDICDERDNDCNGTADDSFTVGGAYTLDTACGGCGNNCTTRWNLGTHHATGACNASGDPSCAFTCVPDAAGGGTSCSSNVDCVGDMAGPTCDTSRRQCATTCTSNAQCPGLCSNGYCTIACTTDAQCRTAFGLTATCVANACVTQTSWADRDGLELNGCECPASANGEDTPDLPSAYPTSSFATVDRDCDGIDGDIARALFVSAGGTGSGTLAAPFGSIQAAITAFNPSLHRHILVSTGTYVERVTLSAGVQVYGGYSVDFRSHDIALHRTVITAPAPDFGVPVPDDGVVRARDISTDTLFAGFTIQGYDVSTAGRSSYAVLLERCTAALRFTHNTVVAGRGGAGSSGSAGVTGTRGGDGGNGNGAALCTSSTCAGNSQAGGPRGANGSCAVAAGCAGMESDGAETTQVASAPVAGCAYAAGGNRGTYTSGNATFCRYDFTPPAGDRNGSSGALGATGGNGTAGGGCGNPAGSLVSGRFVAATGTAGSNGNPGAGGQGGSAGGGATNNKLATCTIPSLGNNQGDLGGSGGGGGAGGCGGAPGQSGTGGGASVAVLVVPAGGGQTPTVRANLITRVQGGTGGAGGPGGAGGLGGNPGRGGLSAWPSWAAGQGGDGGGGGAGGDGGGGGGGCGGVSYGIVGAGIPAAALTSNNVFGVPNATATGGAGGLGGYASGSAAGQNGQNGESSNVRSY